MRVGVVGSGGLLRIRVVLAASVLLLVPLAVLSNITHSLALVLEAYHMLYNVLTLAGCLVAVRLASAGGSAKNTYGWRRLEVLLVVTSLLFLAALCFSVSVEAVQSAVHAGHQDTIHHPLYIMVCTAAVLLGHLLCYLLVGGYTHLQSTFLMADAGGGVLPAAVTFSPYAAEARLWLHFLRDLGGTLLAAAGAAAVFCSRHWLLQYLDPVLAVVGCIILLTTSVGLLRSCCLILLQNSPQSFDAEQFCQLLLRRCPQLQDVHELHVWQLTPGTHVATAHVVLAEPRQFADAATAITAYFRQQGIGHVTLQPEFTATRGSGPLGRCLLPCRNAACEAASCCRAPPPPPVIKITPPSQASLRSMASDQPPGQVSGDIQLQSAVGPAQTGGSDQQSDDIQQGSQSEASSQTEPLESGCPEGTHTPEIVGERPSDSSLEIPCDCSSDCAADSVR